MRLERVSYVVDGDTVVGHLHLPDGPGPHRAVVVGGPMTSVKEQVTGTYALHEDKMDVTVLDVRANGNSLKGMIPPDQLKFQVVWKIEGDSLAVTAGGKTETLTRIK